MLPTRLAIESETYRQNRRKLLAKHAGRFVLIHGREIVGTYGSQRAALAAGYTRFGYVDLFTKEILADEPQVAIASRWAVPSAKKTHA